MDQDLIKKYGSQLERVGWSLSFCAMLTQIGRFAFPSYNIVLGFWAVYSSFSRHGRATFGFITFTFLSLLLDIIFCSLNAQEEKFAQYTFSLIVFIVCMFIKLFGIYTGAHFFSAIGGAYSMEYNLNNAYEPLNHSVDSSGDSSQAHSQHSHQQQPTQQQLHMHQQQMQQQQMQQAQMQQAQMQQQGGYYPPNQPSISPSSSGPTGHYRSPAPNSAALPPLPHTMNVMHGQGQNMNMGGGNRNTMDVEVGHLDDGLL